jgi:amino acid transporter
MTVFPEVPPCFPGEPEEAGMSDQAFPASEPAPDPSVPQADDATMSEFGYRQELRRSLRLFSLYAIAFSFISITTGIYLNFAVGIDAFGPLSIWFFGILGVAQLLVALVMAELGSRIPLAGYAYQWGSRLINPGYGWVLGFTALLWMVTGMAGICSLAAAPIIATLFGWNAGSQSLLLVIALIIIVAATAVNVISIALAAKFNNAAVGTEIIGTALLGVILFIVWLVHSPHTHGLGFLFSTGGVHGSAVWKVGIPFSILMGAYTLAGFEVAADLSEEGINVRFTVPRAIIWSLVSATVLGMIALIGFVIAIPNLHVIQSSATPLPDIIKYWLGGGLTKVFLVFVIFSILGLAVALPACQARIIYSLSRDNMLPFSRALRKVNPQRRTPVAALLVSAGLTIAFVLWGYYGAHSFLILVVASAAFPFVIYFFTLIAYWFRRNHFQEEPGSFTLGRWRTPVVISAFVWVVFVLVCLMAPSAFHQADYLIVGAPAFAFIWYLVVLRRRLKMGLAGPQSAEGGGTPDTKMAAEQN